MEHPSNLLLWTEQGYQLFAEEGMEGVQVERLARILHLNKSGFYHYFGDLEGFSAELIRLHLEKAEVFVEGIKKCDTFNPDYLNLLIGHATTVMFQVQLTRNKEQNSFYKTSEFVDQRINVALRNLWADYIGPQHNSDLSLRYYFMVRDMFYTRVSFDNLNYEFLDDLARNAKELIDQITHRSMHEST